MPIETVGTAAFLPLVLPYCPQCPDFIAEQQVRFAAIEFCERSRAWRHMITVSLTGPEGEMVAPEFAAIHEIEFANFNDQPLTPVQFSTINPNQTGRPRYVTQVSPNALTVSPYDEPGDLEVSVFLKPLANMAFETTPGRPIADRFNVVPKFMLDIHGTAIARGALSKILAIPGEPWSDPRMALKHEADFRENMDAAFRWNMRGQQRAPIRTKFKDF